MKDAGRNQVSSRSAERWKTENEDDQKQTVSQRRHSRPRWRKTKKWNLNS